MNVLFYVAVPRDLIYAAILIPNGIELVERAGPKRWVYFSILVDITGTLRLAAAVRLAAQCGRGVWRKHDDDRFNR